MLSKIKDAITNIFHTDEKEEAAEKQKSAALQQKTNNVFGTNANSTFNPFLKKSGELFNPNLDYQRLLDNPKISQRAKQFITQATGLSPTATATSTTNGTATSNSGVAYTSSGTPIQRTATGNTIADAAQKYVGTPYVWGGESMEEGGMDCSGFVYNALKDAGYDVGRTTAQGYRSYGTSVSKSDMQPGDLIFFGKNNNDASHIGIYLGNGKMIHSSGGSSNTKSNPGKGVNIADVNYRSDFLEARRY